MLDDLRAGASFQKNLALTVIAALLASVTYEATYLLDKRDAMVSVVFLKQILPAVRIGFLAFLLSVIAYHRAFVLSLRNRAAHEDPGTVGIKWLVYLALAANLSAALWGATKIFSVPTLIPDILFERIRYELAVMVDASEGVAPETTIHAARESEDFAHALNGLQILQQNFCYANKPPDDHEISTWPRIESDVDLAYGAASTTTSNGFLIVRPGRDGVLCTSDDVCMMARDDLRCGGAGCAHVNHVLGYDRCKNGGQG